MYSVTLRQWAVSADTHSEMSPDTTSDQSRRLKTGSLTCCTLKTCNDHQLPADWLSSLERDSSPSNQVSVWSLNCRAATLEAHLIWVQGCTAVSQSESSITRCSHPFIKFNFDLKSFLSQNISQRILLLLHLLLLILQLILLLLRQICSRAVLKYKFEVFVLYLSIFFSCHFLLLLQHILEGNIDLFPSLHLSDRSL